MKNRERKTKSNKNKGLLQKILKMGNATFLPGFTRAQMSMIVKNMSESKHLKQDVWTIATKTHEFMLDIFKFMQSSDVDRLQILMLSHLPQQTFTQIVQVRYEYLTELRFFSIHLTNVQNLAFLDAPNLKVILLGNNNITQGSKVLAKTLFSNLQQFDLNSNLIVEMQIGRYKTPKLFSSFNHYNRDIENHYGSLNYLAKAQQGKGLLIRDFLTGASFYTPKMCSRKVIKVLGEKQKNISTH